MPLRGELYCPLCNGVRLDTCELQACIQMRQVISDKLAEGVSKEQIKQEFVAEYGPKVLGEPPSFRSRPVGLDCTNCRHYSRRSLAIVHGKTMMSCQPEVGSGVRCSQLVGLRLRPLGCHAASTDAYLAQVETDLANLE